MICECADRWRSSRNQPPPSNKPPTPIYYARGLRAFRQGNRVSHSPQSKPRREQRHRVLEVVRIPYPKSNQSRSRQCPMPHRTSPGRTLWCRLGFPGLKRTRDLSHDHHSSPETWGNGVRCVLHQMRAEIVYREWSFCSANHFELIKRGRTF